MLLASDLFDAWLKEQLPFNKESWTVLLNTWLKPKTCKQLWKALDKRAKKLIRDSIEVEFIDYPLNGSTWSPMKNAMWYFRFWLKQLDWQIGFLSGNRPWCEALEKVGVCFVKKRQQGDNASGVFQLDNEGVIILKINDDGPNTVEEYHSVLEAVLLGGWTPD